MTIEQGLGGKTAIIGRQEYSKAIRLRTGSDTLVQLNGPMGAATVILEEGTERLKDAKGNTDTLMYWIDKSEAKGTWRDI